jgi:Cupin superfamily (DUF985)
LKPHPEGGHYRETLRDSRSGESRAVSTAIYFLLAVGEECIAFSFRKSFNWLSMGVRKTNCRGRLGQIRNGSGTSQLIGNKKPK